MIRIIRPLAHRWEYHDNANPQLSSNLLDVYLHRTNNFVVVVVTFTLIFVMAADQHRGPIWSLSLTDFIFWMQHYLKTTFTRLLVNLSANSAIYLARYRALWLTWTEIEKFNLKTMQDSYSLSLRIIVQRHHDGSVLWCLWIKIINTASFIRWGVSFDISFCFFMRYSTIVS